MRRISYIVGFISLSFVFVMAYYCCYFYAINKMKSNEIKTIYETMDENPALSDNVADADSVKEDIVDNSTQYILETYDVDKETITKEEMAMPVEFLGMDRQSLIDYLSEYSSNEDEGITNVQLVSFSNASVIIRKSIKHENKVQYNYWVIGENGVVKVYKADKKELYLDTGITTDYLEKEDKNNLKNGFYLENIEELYNYLETITS